MKILGSLLKRIEVITFVLSFVTVLYVLIFFPARYFTWHALTRSPEPAKEIIDTTWNTVTVRTVSNNKFVCNIYDVQECWAKVDYEPLKVNPLWCFPNEPSNEHTVQIAKACNQIHTFGIVGTIYSLHDDGIIYVKHKGIIGPMGYSFSATLALFCAFIVFLFKRIILYTFHCFKRK